LTNFVVPLNKCVINGGTNPIVASIWYSNSSGGLVSFIANSTNSIAGTDLTYGDYTTGYTNRTFNFTGVTLNATTKYAIALIPVGTAQSKYYCVNMNQAGITQQYVSKGLQTLNTFTTPPIRLNSQFVFWAYSTGDLITTTDYSTASTSGALKVDIQSAKTITVLSPATNPSTQFNSSLNVLFYYPQAEQCYFDINGVYYDDLPNNPLTNSTFTYNMYPPNLYNFTVRCATSDNNVTYTVNASNLPPRVDNYSRSPLDITSTSGFIIGQNLTYNYTDRIYYNETLSTEHLHFKVNSSISDCLQIYNGTASCGYSTITASPTTNGTYTYNVFDNQLYPGIYNLPERPLELTPHITNSLTSQNQFLSSELIGMKATDTYNYLELMPKWISGPSALQIIYCNSTYAFSNSPLSNANCNNFYNLPTTFIYNHSHSQYSNHTVIPMNVNNGKIGTVSVSNISYIILRSQSNWDIYYVSNVSRTGQMKKSSNQGNSYSNIVGTTDLHIHQYEGDEVFRYYSCVNDTLGAENCSTERTDNIDITVLGPNAPTVLTPSDTNYIKDSTIAIAWTNATAFGNYTRIAYYNVTLLNGDGSYNSVLNGNVSLNTSYDWDTTGTALGNYYVQVTAYDNLSQTASGTSTIFTIRNPNLLINVTSPTINEHINTLTFAFNYTLLNPIVGELNNCSLFLNDAYYESNVTETSGTINITGLSEGVYLYYLNCTRLDTYSYGYYNATAVQNFTVDITLPTLTHNANDIVNGGQYYYSNITSNFTAGDTYLLLCYINATCQDGTNIYSKEYNWSGSVTGSMTDYIDSSLCGQKGTVGVLRQCADIHTADEIKEYKSKNDNVKKSVEFETTASKKVTIAAVTPNSISEVTTQKKVDRVSFTFTPIIEETKKDKNGKELAKTKKTTQEFTITGTDLRKLTNTPYKGHIVQWNGFGRDANGVPLSRWFDFENTNDYPVDVLQQTKDSYLVKVDCSKDNCEVPITFQSSGSLNINEETLVYYYNIIGTINTTIAYTQPIVDNFSTSYSMNVTYWNEQLYPTNWTYDGNTTKPYAILNLYGTNIDQNFTATATERYIIDSYSNTYTYAVEPYYFYVNYTKPFSASLALWHVKHGLSEYNVTIPEICTKDTIELRMYGYRQSPAAPDYAESYVECKNATTWYKIGKEYYNGGGSDQGADDSSRLYDGDWNTWSCYNNNVGGWGRCDTLGYAKIYEQDMYFGQKLLTFTADITVPIVNNSYNFTSHRWFVTMQNVTGSNVTFETSSANQTLYQAIVNVRLHNVDTGATILGANIIINSTTTSNIWNNSFTTDEYTTFYVNALNQTLSATKGNYTPLTYNFSLAYGENRTIDLAMFYISMFGLYDESTLGEFNISSADRVQFILTCLDGTETIETVNVTSYNVSITCEYLKYKFVLDYPAGVTYYRTFISDNGPGVLTKIFLINVLTTSYIANTFTIDDLLTDYDDVSIFVKRNLEGVDYVITSDFVDIEQKITTWLMTNREYSVEVHSSNNPDKIIGGYTASTTGNKAIKLYDISLNNPPTTFEGNVVYSAVPDTNRSDNISVVTFFYNDKEVNATENVTFELFRGSDLITPFATYHWSDLTGTLPIDYTYEMTTLTNVSLINESVYAKITIVRNGETRFFWQTINQVVTMGKEFIEYIGPEFLNWFFIIFLSTLALVATYSTANYMVIIICGLGIMLNYFGFFTLGIGIMGFSLLLGLFSIFSSANKGND
jgi:hypothetical protein